MEFNLGDLAIGIHPETQHLCGLWGFFRGDYLFANARATRIKLLVHDGFGVWCAARRLNTGSFMWPRADALGTAPVALTQAQFDALVLGLWTAVSFRVNLVSASSRTRSPATVSGLR